MLISVYAFYLEVLKNNGYHCHVLYEGNQRNKKRTAPLADVRRTTVSAVRKTDCASQRCQVNLPKISY